MRRVYGWLGFGICSIALVACAASEKAASAGQPAATTYSGWYLEHAGQGQFQLCGQSQPLRVVVAADLPVRAKAFGLEEDTPVYVRLKGLASGVDIQVSSVEQFGSPTPVRNCGLNGVVIPSKQ